MKQEVTKKFVFFGASVTVQKTGYVPEIQSLLSKIDQMSVTVIPEGYGGMQITNAALIFLENCFVHHPSHLFIDWFSCIYALKYDVRPYVQTFIHACQAHGCQIVFLLIPRVEGTDKKYNELRKIVREEFGAYLIDIEKEVDNWRTHCLKDEVHTNDIGSKKYAEIVLKHCLINEKTGFPQPKVVETTRFCELGKFFPIEQIRKRLVMQGNGTIIGMIHTVGPHSHVIRLKHILHSGEVINLKNEQIWDAWCHYDRQNCNLSSLELNGSLEIEVLQTTDCDVDWSVCRRKGRESTFRCEKFLKNAVIYYVGNIQLVECE